MKHVALTNSESISLRLALCSYLHMIENGEVYVADSTRSDLLRVVAELERKE